MVRAGAALDSGGTPLEPPPPLVINQKQYPTCQMAHLQAAHGQGLGAAIARLPPPIRERSIRSNTPPVKLAHPQAAHGQGSSHPGLLQDGGKLQVCAEELRGVQVALHLATLVTIKQRPVPILLNTLPVGVRYEWGRGFSLDEAVQSHQRTGDF